MSALIEEGYARCREVTRRHARSFYFASFLLHGHRRKAAFALYAFCRRLDDVVDVEEAEDAPRRLAQASEVIRATFGLARADWTPPPPFVASELAALADAAKRFSIPAGPLLELVEGMRMDLVPRRYEEFSELETYCYRVAGTVGLLLCAVLGITDRSASSWAFDRLRPNGDPVRLSEVEAAASSATARAIELGIAMQLTNILRDVAEDLRRGRLYLPRGELAAFGLDEEALRAQVRDERWRAFMRCQIARARAYYARAAAGIPSLASGRWMVRAMAAIYGGILREIERRQYDVHSARAAVPGWRKALLLLGAAVPQREALYLPPIPVLPTMAEELAVPPAREEVA